MPSLPPIEFDYRQKADILPAVLKGGTLIAGGLFAFNSLLDKPIVGDALVAYRKTMHKFFRMLGGEHFSDPNILDAGAVSAIDVLTFASIVAAGGIAGRLGQMGKSSPSRGAISRASPKASK